MSHTSSRSVRRRRRAWNAAGAIGAASAAGLLVAANSGAGGTGGVDCPDKATNHVVLMGLSSSGDDSRVIGERRSEIRHQIAVAADRGTDLIVRAWSTAGAVRTL